MSRWAKLDKDFWKDLISFMAYIFIAMTLLIGLLTYSIWLFDNIIKSQHTIDYECEIQINEALWEVYQEIPDWKPSTIK